MWTRVAVVLIGLVAVAHAAPDNAWSITPPAGWAEIPTPDEQAGVTEMKTVVAEAGGSYDLITYEADAGQRLTVVYMNVPGKPDVSPRVLTGWAGSARELGEKLPKADSYKITETEQLILVDHISEAGRTIRFAGIDADSALVTLQASCTGPETACNAALTSLKLDASTFKKLPKPGSKAIRRDEASKLSHRIGFIVGASLVLSVVVGGILHFRRRSRRST